MTILLCLALILSMSTSDFLLKNTSHVSVIFHQKCVQILPQKMKERSSLSSLLCGEKITDVELKEKLQKTSLIHIFVISGAHLLLLDQLLSILKIPVFVRFLILTVYALATGFEPPAVRALVGMMTRFFLQKYRLFFPSDLQVLAAGFLTLTFFPSWWGSLSLLMSWCASLALCAPSLFQLRSGIAKTFVTQCAIFLLMALPLWGLGNLHPLSFMFNVFLAPAVAFLLLPLGALCVVIPALSPVFDSLMATFRWLLQGLSDPVTPRGGVMFTVPQLWLWILFLHLSFHFLRLHLRQGKDCP